MSSARRGPRGSSANYYLNFCTFSYTTAYWDWDRWQREIDWMALHGVSMPLAAVGHEAVLARVYRELGLSEHEILESPRRTGLPAVPVHGLPRRVGRAAAGALADRPRGARGQDHRPGA